MNNHVKEDLKRKMETKRKGKRDILRGIESKILGKRYL